MSIVTPMMRQYQEVKAEYPDCLLFFRLGDFYELFFEDAKIAAQALNIVLTARDGGQGEKVPMCGVPYHSVDNYLSRLIEQGHKVAICEQLEDPKTAKGIVKRGVIRVVTPGTVIEENMLNEKQHNYLAACWKDVRRSGSPGFGLAYVDISSGEFSATQFIGEDAESELVGELNCIRPAELVLQESLYQDPGFQAHFWDHSVGSFSLCPDESFIRNNCFELLQTHFHVSSMEGLGLEEKPLAAFAVAMTLVFLQHTQKRSLDYIDRLRVYDCGEFMFLDAATRRNLELTATLRNKNRRGSLIWVLDDTHTSMGARLLKEWIESPLLSSEAINRRLDAVEELINKPQIFHDLRDILRQLYDMPRLISRICYGNAGPRDLVALRQTAAHIPTLFQIMAGLQSPLFQILFDSFDQLEDIAALITSAINEDPPLSPKDSGVIRSGYNSEVDELRQLAGSAKEHLLQMEAHERERTGIKNLKISYNKVFGYYIEISKSRVHEAPTDYIRKQTLVNGERFITDALKKLETRILGASERLADLEYSLFVQIREQIASSADRILQCADVVAHLDVLQSLASIAITNGYCKPMVNDGTDIIIQDGRHPVVEKIIGRENFMPNDTYLDQNTQRMMLITGPNMAGKSTYMRQVALIVLLARIGSFVPAAAAQIGYCDRIFTRVGAADDLASGQSTFMVEMNETSNILRHANKNSLIILDEIGRGTSTFDGLSIAGAVAEFIIQDCCGAKTLFATHYHELTALSDTYPLISNYSISVKEKGHDIIFLRKIVKGAADKSYGIQVARLAGLPPAVLARAAAILQQLEQENHLHGKLNLTEQLSFDALLKDVKPLEESPILLELRNLDVDSLTPIEALLKINQWKRELN